MKYWLMKAEPNSRIEKGKDVKFSVDDFEASKTTAWEGVRSHEAKNLMQSMKIGDQVLFYHSNCKNPGVAGFAEISKEAYPDHTAWDPDHPYFDPKSDKDSPKWFMVDATFRSRATHFVPLTLFKHIAGQPTDEPPEEVAYIGQEGVRAIKEMALIRRGRLSVQPVEEDAWKAVQVLAEKGGWEAVEALSSSKKGRSSKKNADNANERTKESAASATDKETKTKGRHRTKRNPSTKEDGDAEKTVDEKVDEMKVQARKRKAKTIVMDGYESSDETTCRRKSVRHRRQ